ncbi:hypothetical protein [Actinoplanes sp. NPDC049118]|uniref:hypothetical protein n=1 Tax=Actinoplanes sp. NPDC049118 TaxID=3155769 RepID=UPI0033C425B2
MTSDTTVREAPGRPARTGLLRIERVEEPPPKPVRLADLIGVAGVRPATPDGCPVVLMRPAAGRALRPDSFPADSEQGGFLLGRRFRDADAPQRTVLEVTEARAARGTGSRCTFTFPAESFLRVGRLVANSTDIELLGWYHTHPVAVYPGHGMSDMDVELHRTVFRRPWQIAVLVNLEPSCRGLRMFRLAGGRFHDIPFTGVRRAGAVVA